MSSHGGDTRESARHAIAVRMPDIVEVFVAAPEGTVCAMCWGRSPVAAAPDDWSWSSALPPDAATGIK